MQEQIWDIVERRTVRILSGYRRTGKIDFNHYAKILKDLVPELAEQEITDFNHIKNLVKNGIISGLSRDVENLRRELDLLHSVLSDKSSTITFSSLQTRFFKTTLSTFHLYKNHIFYSKHQSNSRKWSSRSLSSRSHTQWRRVTSSLNRFPTTLQSSSPRRKTISIYTWVTNVLFYSNFVANRSYPVRFDGCWNCKTLRQTD